MFHTGALLQSLFFCFDSRLLFSAEIPVVCHLLRLKIKVKKAGRLKFGFCCGPALYRRGNKLIDLSFIHLCLHFYLLV